MARGLNLRMVLPLAAVAGCALVLALLSPAIPGNPLATAAPAPTAAARPVTARLARLDLETLRSAFADANPSRARALTKQLLQAGAADAEQLHAWLHRSTRVPGDDYKSVLRAVGASVPDRRGRFNAAENVLDWLEKLLELGPGKLTRPLRRARAEAGLSVALMRALAASRHPEAALSLLRFAYRHQGAFRDEAGRQIRAMGASAVPALLRATALKDPEAHRMVRYAAYQLDRIDCARPDRALKQADPELRVEILHAYGETRSAVAVNAVLGYTDEAVEAVRRGARWAMLRYVSGRPPKVVKRKLKLPGGKETDRERALYLTYRQLATHALVDRLAKELAGDSEGTKLEAIKRGLGEEAEPRYLAERLFALFDARREEAQAAELRVALELAARGDRDAALARFDKILAADPYHGQRQAMAPLYFGKGQTLLAAGKLEEAQAFLTKAMHLAPDAKFVPEAKARRALAEALADRGMSSQSEWKLREALRLYPPLEQASMALQAYKKKQQQRLWWASGIGGSIALGLIFGLALLRRRLSW